MKCTRIVLHIPRRVQPLGEVALLGEQAGADKLQRREHVTY